MLSTDILTRRIHTTEALHSVIKSMRALAALNMRQFERVVQSQEQYFQTIERGLQSLLKMKAGRAISARPHREDSRTGVIVFGSDQGLCGSFNEHIATFSLANLDTLPHQNRDLGLVAVGRRVARHLQDAGRHIEECLPTPSSRTGITVMAQDLLVTIEHWQREQEFTRILLYYHAFTPGIAFTPRRFDLLPTDDNWLHRLEQQPWPSRVLPRMSMDWDRLFSHLIRQYLFIALSRALAESLACENASRLAAMQAAERNIGEHREELIANFQASRQSSITEELLDIVGGYEVLTRFTSRQRS